MVNESFHEAKLDQITERERALVIDLFEPEAPQRIGDMAFAGTDVAVLLQPAPHGRRGYFRESRRLRGGVEP